MNWDLGTYEHLAAHLHPAAVRVVGELAPQPGETVLDLGCGTGNATLLVAARGARVIGVDPSPRLLDVARARAADAGPDVQFVPGEAAAVPVPDGSLDAVVSVFAVIFAPDAAAAAVELARVLRPGGRLVLSAWLRDGALADQSRLRGELVAGLAPDVTAGPAFAWHEPQALTALLAPHGFTVTAHEETHAFTAPSPRAYAETQLADHPSWVEARALLEPAGRWDQVHDELVALFTAANEDPDAFLVTSRYLLATATLHA